MQPNNNIQWDNNKHLKINGAKLKQINHKII